MKNLYRIAFKVLNLFLALLLSSFGADKLKKEDKEDKINKIQEAVERIKRFFRYIYRNIAKIFGKNIRNVKKSRSDVDQILGRRASARNGEEDIRYGMKSKNSLDFERYSISSSTKILKCQLENDKCVSIVIPTLDANHESNVPVEGTPPDCFPKCCYARKKFLCYRPDENSYFSQNWTKLRTNAFKYLEHRYFEIFIIIMIICSSISLVYFYNYFFIFINLKNQNILNHKYTYT